MSFVKFVANELIVLIVRSIFAESLFIGSWIWHCGSEKGSETKFADRKISELLSFQGNRPKK